MKNILTTIPKSKFKSWEIAERTLKMCDGTTEWDENGPWFWLINTNNLPKSMVLGESVCYMVFDGVVRGYFDIVDSGLSENCRWTHDIGKMRNTKCIVMANWHPCKNLTYTGFQWWRYTEMRP